MSPEYKEVSHAISVPKGTGVEGFLHTVRELLKLDRLQEVVIDARGYVRYKRYTLDGESAQPLAIDYEGLQPHFVIRHGEITEIFLQEKPAASIPAVLCDEAGREGLWPTAWATGAASTFWAWYKRAGVPLGGNKTLCGLPVYYDSGLTDTALYLCAAHNRGASLVDCHRFFKFELEDMPRLSVEVTTVEVL
jgi:hypothetical protein